MIYKCHMTIWGFKLTVENDNFVNKFLYTISNQKWTAYVNIIWGTYFCNPLILTWFNSFFEKWQDKDNTTVFHVYHTVSLFALADSFIKNP